MSALQGFSQALRTYQVLPERVIAIATSAFRNAKNTPQILADIQYQTGIAVKVISGEQEAAYIYKGVQRAIDFKNQNALIMDIGGGSVEFILANQTKIHWKQSYEIGAQRLYDKFMLTDPIKELDLQRMEFYLEAQLAELTKAFFAHTPQMFIGSAGTFDTLAEIHYIQSQGTDRLSDFTDNSHELKQKHYEMDLDDFYSIYQRIVWQDRADRLLIPGMIELRVDMIVVSVSLLKFIIEKLEIDRIHISAYSLKEGVLGEVCGG
jgi:exopolyphosphatase/guanosine-5'-triphosphate,3'-diphosphate pyrophosphatase